MKTLLLIDANSIIHRAFHALPPLTSKGGAPAGAIYGLASILLKLWREEKPNYAAALFDRPEPTFRKEKFAEYKAQRPKTPDELIAQIIEAHELFPAFGVSTFEKPGFEADDLIATLTTKFCSEPDLRIVVLTGDKDTLQLVQGDKIVVRTFKKGISDTMTYDEKSVREKYGLRPDQLIDYKALVGDPSDNIKGVPGIGPKTATAILKKFGNLKGAYDNLSTAPDFEKKLCPHKDAAFLAQSLVTLERHVSVELAGLEELALKGGKGPIKEYFHARGFKALVKRLDGNGEALALALPKSRKQQLF